MEVPNELIYFGFKGGDRESISVDDHTAKWEKEWRFELAVFSKSTLKKAVKYTLQSWYFKLGNDFQANYWNSNGSMVEN